MVDGIEVMGRISHRSSGDLTIVIEKPYRLFRNGRHLPCIARGQRSYLGPWGDKRAVELLEEVYQFCRFVDENEEELRSGLLKLEASLMRDKAAVAAGRKGKKFEQDVIFAYLRMEVPFCGDGLLAQLIDVLKMRATYKGAEDER